MHTRVWRADRLWRYLALCGVSSALALAGAAPAGAALTPGLTFGGGGTGNGQFRQAQGAAIDPTTGDVWVVDYGTGENDGRLEKFSPSGQYLLSADTSPAGGSYGPVGVAVNASGDVFVADSQQFRVLEFDSGGSFIQSISDGNLVFPQYVAVDPSNPNNVYVSQGSVGNDVVEYTVSGSSSSYVRTFGNSGGGALNNAQGVGINNAGDVYVVDAGDDLVKEYGTSGTYIQSFGGSGDGQFSGPTALAIDPLTDNVVVSDGSLLKTFDSGGNFMSSLQGTGGSDSIAGVAVDPSNGDEYAVDGVDNQVTKFTGATGEVEQPLGSRLLAYPDTAVADATDPTTGDLYIDYGAKVEKRDANGNLISTITVVPDGTASSDGVAVDSSGNVFVSLHSDSQSGNPAEVVEYNASGQYVTTFGVNTLQTPNQLAVDPANGEVLVADSGDGSGVTNTVDAFDPSTGQLVSSFGVAAAPNKPVAVQAQGIAVNAAGTRVYVSDNEGELFGYTPTGTRLFEQGGQGTGAGQLLDLLDAAVDPSTGSVYVVDGDVNNSGIIRFDANGNYLGQLSVGLYPFGVAVGLDPNASNYGDVYAVASPTGGTNLYRFGKPAPANTSSPSITGTAQDGQTLTAGAGSWSSPDTLTYAYQWQDCPSGGGGCTNVASGGTSASYKATAADVGSFLQVVVTATDQQGKSGGASVRTTDVVAKPPAPANTVTPSLTGTAKDGQTLTAGHGTWTSPDALSYGYRWQDCPSGGGSCSNVASGGTSASYKAAASDVGSFLQVMVTATDQEGQTGTATKETGSVVAKPAAPANKVGPSISGTATDGQTLTAGHGTWTSPDALSYSYQWQDCPSGGGSCSNVASAGTSASYRAAASDVGSFLQVVVTATDPEGQAGSAMKKTAAVVGKPPAPKNTVAPAITGTAKDGQTLTAGHGSWTSPDALSYAYQWQDCPSGGGSCSNVASGGTSASYTAAGSDVGSFLQVVVTATDQESQTGTGSKKTATVVAKPPAPVNTAAPTISGTAQDGQTLTATRGTWTSPDTLTYSYQWQDCRSGGACANVASGGTAASYRAVASDVGSLLQVVVTAADQESQTRTATKKTASSVAKPAPPANKVTPSISGAARDGQTLTASRGTWTSPDALSYAYRWQDCPSGGGSCSNVASGGTSASYTAAASDVGSFLQVVVTATDQEGQTGTGSKKASTVVAKPAPPKNTVAPSVSGTAQPGQTLTAQDGSWSSPDKLTETQVWKRCSSAGTACVTISGANGPTYVVQTADTGHKLQLFVTATDQEAQSASASALTGLVSSSAGG